MPLSTLAEVFQFEKWLDEGARDSMIKQGIYQASNYYTQFESEVAETPRFEIKSIPGAVDGGRQCYILPDGVRTIFNTFQGSLQITVKTNRGEHQKHKALCGAVRASMQQVSLQLGWQGAPINPAQPIVWASDVLVLTDIYLNEESQSSVDDAQNLDVTMVPFAILFNVLDTAWPLNI